MATDDDVSGKPRNEFKLTSIIDTIEGNERLSEEDREKLTSVLETISENQQQRQQQQQQQQQQDQATDSREKEGTNDDIIHKEELEKDKKSPAATAERKKKTKQDQQEHPKVGVKSGAKGKVEWKFGGHTCYGTLLPSKETNTHCYARTHKGNVKTLAKGKDYWSMI
jgi:hypothetical protein